MKVLVPTDRGLEVLRDAPELDAVRYEPGAPWPTEHLDATAVVVGFERAGEIGARFGELPELKLVQTLNAGYEQWLPYVPAGVLLSNGRGAHGGSSAEWVVAALLAIYRELHLSNDQQRQGVWLARDTDTLIGKRVVVLGAGDLAVNLAAVDTDALVAELTSGRLRAALDVTDPEPLPPGHPLWCAPGLLLTPHVAGSTTGAWERAWVIAREQLTAYVEGGRPPNLVSGP